MASRPVAGSGFCRTALDARARLAAGSCQQSRIYNRGLCHVCRRPTGTFKVEITTPWRERLAIDVQPPKPDISLDLGPYRRLNRRCAYYACNRLYEQRGKKLYCSEKCQEKSKQYRRKLERADCVEPMLDADLNFGNSPSDDAQRTAVMDHNQGGESLFVTTQ